MSWYEVLISVIATIALFVHSLDHFSTNLKKRANGRIMKRFENVSDSRIKGFLLGMLATALIQSSSAVISIIVSFVDSGFISFTGSLPMLLGSNLGTTVTAWLVTLDIDFLGTVLIVIGFIVGYFPERIRIFSKPVFYLGLILFSLQLLGDNLQPLKDSESIIHFLTYAAHPISGLLLGLLVTAITQSSSVTVGLSIILASQHVINLDSAIGIIVGSNIGTTSTAFIASIKMGRAAKRTALVNFLFNLFGALLYLPLYIPFNNFIKGLDADIAVKVALAHLFFNIGITAIILPLTHTIGRRFEPKTTS
ncbi:MAG: Na/Pi cotransporter family protein [Bacteroidetes bacterium]|nr:MAG: Na/Pi cotransporter family protein [Bacteroidota bacterium]TNE97167.1 MAG: Na/Pi cotransporter family protein [Bacteroidota bacterium]